MANSLGSLVVSLGLDAAQFTSGLTKSEFQARKFAQQMDRAVAAGVIKATIALEAMAGAARLAGDAFQILTTGAADFKDLEETTGASAEGLASLAVAAGTAGVEMASIAGANNKLTKSLVGVDDESKAAGAALKALGLDVKEFKKLDPAAQYEAVGKALGDFADGAGKAAVAQALFGKSGTEQLKVFKALEEQGGRQVILTQRQIELADSYADAQAKASTELRLYAQAAASEATPALTDLTIAGAEFIKTLLGVGAGAKDLQSNNAVVLFAEAGTDALAFLVDSGQGVVRVFKAVGNEIGLQLAVIQTFREQGLAAAQALAKAGRDDTNAMLTAPLFSQQLARARAQRKEMDKLRAQEDRGFDPFPKKRIVFDGAEKADKKAKSAASFTDYATEVSQAVSKLVEDADIVRIAKLNDQLKELDKLQAAGLNSGLVADARAAIYAKLPQQIESAAEAFRRLEIAGTDAVDKAFDADKLDAFIKKQERLDELLGRNALKRQREDMLLLTEAFEAGEISVERYTELVSKSLDIEAKKARSLAEELGLTFTSAFEDAIVAGGDLSDVLKGLEKDILRIVTRKLVTEPLGSFVGGTPGGAGGAGGFLSSIWSFIGGLFGPGKAIGGPVSAGMLYPVNERRPEVLDVGGRQFLMMGSKGGNIDPNPRLGGGRSMTNHISITVPGNTDRRTAGQIGAEVARRIAAANARMN